MSLLGSKHTASEQRLLHDLGLARAGQSGAFERIFAPNKDYARRLSRKFYVSGWERQDLYQEALAGFVAALMAFDPAKNVDFHDFARLWMRNSVVACVRAASSEKRKWESSGMSLDMVNLGESDVYQPELIFERRAELARVLAALLNVLSATEWQVLSGVVAGSSLDDLAGQMGLERRAVENALSRARTKARRLDCSAA